MVIGLVFTLVLVMIKSPFTFYYLAHTFLMIMMAMMIISEFTVILFDTSENVIIQPLPIKGNTVSLARNAHVLIYLAMMAFNLSVATVIAAFYNFGFVSGVVYLITILFNVTFTLFFANILYLGIMRLANGERLKNLLMYFQVFIAVFFMAVYQFGLRMVDNTVISNMVLPVHWYTYLFPPAFFSGLIEGITTPNFDAAHILFISEALILPPLAIFFTGKYLTPVFNRKLMELEQGDRVSKVKSESAHEGLYYRLISSIVVRNAEEKAAFKLMWKITGRERPFKQAFLPAFGYILIMIITPNIGKHGDFSNFIKGDNYLLILYAFMFISLGLSTSLLIGNNQPASWAFKAIPMKVPADFFKGTIKAAFTKFFIPFFLIAATIICIVWGIKVLPDTFIALQVIYLITLLVYYFQQPGFPFTLEKTAVQGGGNAIRIFGIMFITVCLGFFHRFLLHWFDYANLLLIPAYGFAIYYVNRFMIYREITWEKVDRANNFQ